MRKQPAGSNSKLLELTRANCCKKRSPKGRQQQRAQLPVAMCELQLARDHRPGSRLGDVTVMNFGVKNIF